VTHAVAVRWDAAGPRERAEDRRLLDAGELARAARIRHPAVRARFVAAHATLRRLLGDLVGEDPSTFRFGAGRLGRPEPADARGWTVSLAHCVDLVVAAAGHGVQVGIDAERRDRRPLPPPARWCSPAEVAACGRPEATGAALPLVLWTGKEALAKATGIGMGLTFAELDLLGPGRLEPGGQVPLAGWGLVRWLDLSPHHVIALATLPVLPPGDRDGLAASAAPCGSR
jgi:4'-phosphopantetheinyl transferase